jgi:hypothetical protein
MYFSDMGIKADPGIWKLHILTIKKLSCRHFDRQRLELADAAPVTVLGLCRILWELPLRQPAFWFAASH